MELLDYFVRFFLALLLPSDSLHDNETKLLSPVFIRLSLKMPPPLLGPKKILLFAQAFSLIVSSYFLVVFIPA